MSRLTDSIKNKYIKLLKKTGEKEMFNKCVGQAFIQAANTKNIDIELLNLSEDFYLLFRHENLEEYAIISKILRRTAHLVHRKLNSNKLNDRFLRAI